MPVHCRVYYLLEQSDLRLREMRRREFITMMGGAVIWPLGARARQSTKEPRVGTIWIAPLAVVAPFIDAFRQGLRELGYVDGETIAIEVRFAEGKPERLPGLAEELVRLQVDVFWAPSSTILRALRDATATIPIVMSNVTDPVASGFVESLKRPGGNVTGFASLTLEQIEKNVELCKEAIPGLSRLAVLVNPAAADATAVLKEAQAAARKLGIDVHLVEARQAEALEGAISQARELGSNGLLVSTIEGLFFSNRARIIDATLKHRLPAVFAAPSSGLTKSGALLVYGASSLDMHRRAASYVDRILKGDKPADLPIQQPTKFELGVNLATARALGITIPASILLRADEVIE
jgi:putative ABC transport system substrate-binding protein